MPHLIPKYYATYRERIARISLIVQGFSSFIQTESSFFARSRFALLSLSVRSLFALCSLSVRSLLAGSSFDVITFLISVFFGTAEPRRREPFSDIDREQTYPNGGWTILRLIRHARWSMYVGCCEVGITGLICFCLSLVCLHLSTRFVHALHRALPRSWAHELVLRRGILGPVSKLFSITMQTTRYLSSEESLPFSPAVFVEL